jgi:starch-binding outer membrane protein, SusD/RagB family
MKKYLNKTGILAIILIFAFHTSCEKLEVENLNQPNMADVLSSPDDVRGVVQDAFYAYWTAIRAYNVGMTAQVTADQTTVSWGNFAWRDMSEEPRRPWNNSPSYGDSDMTEDPWYDLYATISQVNDALIAIYLENMEIGPNGRDNDMVRATSYLLRGISLGQLGMVFDQAQIPLHDSDLSALEFLPWNVVIEAAIEDLKEAIKVSEASTFAWGADALPGITVNQDFVTQLANSYAARFLALGARSKAQNDNMSWTDKYSWSDVETFASKGLTEDFAPVGDGLPWDGGTWWDLNIKYLRQPGWGRVDMRVVNLLDPATPVRYPTDAQGLAVAPPQIHAGLAPGESQSADARFTVDYQFLPSNDFRPERGGWHFTHYRHSRYDYPASTSDEGYHMGESRGPLFELRAYDNQLMKAEAMARTGKIAEAVAILNDPANPRKSRGNLPDVAASESDILAAIFYERYTELFHCGWMIHFHDMRRTDQLQRGTPLHFPVPGKELEALGMEIYTFGGWDNADGVNTSNGGDWIKPFYHF